jgi:sRNA-binding carbon storage regulator CsrA
MLGLTRRTGEGIRITTKSGEVIDIIFTTLKNKQSTFVIKSDRQNQIERFENVNYEAAKALREHIKSELKLEKASRNRSKLSQLMQGIDG